MVEPVAEIGKGQSIGDTSRHVAKFTIVNNPPKRNKKYIKKTNSYKLLLTIENYYLIDS